MTTYDIAGQTVTMPVEVRDASAGTVIFEVDAAAASALLPTSAFEVLESSPGRAQVALGLIDYRDNDLGAYHEVGIILFVRPAAGGPDGSFITRLPVDQAFTCEAGNVIWGFPKTVEQIDVVDGAGTTTWTLTMDGELVLRLTIPRGGSEVMEAMALTSYTLLDGVPHATAFTQGGSESSLGLGEGVVLELGSHPVSKELESLGLPAPAVLSTWTGKMKATFETPVPL
ncbi:MAG: putative acetoacetate decarboxylase [Frankiales bacterium]|nr:putative acetoacetate decarboxylase [Frankiales bacterium]